MIFDFNGYSNKIYNAAIIIFMKIHFGTDINCLFFIFLDLLL